MATINFLAGKIVSLKDDGTVNAGGKVTFYVADGTFSTPITTYSNKALTTPNSSPIILDSAGRAKAYFSVNADVRILTSTDVLVYSERDVAPQNVKTVYTKATSFAIDASYADSVIEITAALTATINSAATLGAGFSFTIVNIAAVTSTLARANGGDTINGTAANLTIQANSSIEVTVNSAATGFLVDTIGVFPISVANGGTGSTTASAARTALAVGGLADNNTWTGTQTLTGKSVIYAEGASVASAATTNIWAGDGNTLHVTGSTGPITSFGTAPQAGAVMWVIFDGTPTITHNGTTINILNGGASVTVAAGDMFRVYADTTTQFDCVHFKSIGASNTDVQTFTSSGTWTKPGLPSTSKVIIELWGGGGSGARGESGNMGGGGGGGYNRLETVLSALGATETVTIGPGGAAVTSAANGNPGTNSTFGSLLTAYAGGGGGSGATGAGGGGGGELGAGQSAVASTVGDGGRGFGGTSGSGLTVNVGGTGGLNSANGEDAHSLFSGSGGGGGGGLGGTAYYGGAGGAGAGGGNRAAANSINGGDGGSVSSSVGTAGVQPAGGGAASVAANSGAGAAGKCIVTVYPG